MIEKIISILKGKRFLLHDEKSLQLDIYNVLVEGLSEPIVRKEYILDSRNTIDFLINGEYGIEVKIKAKKRAIYKQCERYCSFDKIKKLLLVTNTSMGFPKQINGKDCYVLNLGKAWL